MTDASGGPDRRRWTAPQWIGRALGLAASLLFVWFLVDKGGRVVPALGWADPRGMPLFLVLLGAVIGAMLAWRWELAGGLLAVAGALGILGLVLVGSGASMLAGTLLFITPLLLAGLFYLGDYLMRRATKKS